MISKREVQLAKEIGYIRITVTVTYKYKLLESYNFWRILQFQWRTEQANPVWFVQMLLSYITRDSHTANRVSVKEGRL